MQSKHTTAVRVRGP